MKTNCWLVLGAMLATSAIAQDNTNALPATTAPVAAPTAEGMAAPADTTTPEAAPVKHKKKRPASAARLWEPTVSLVPGPAEVTVSNLIVRGQAGLRGEVIAHVAMGDAVTVLSQVNLGKHAADEPAQWAKIACPTNIHVWVGTKFIDATNRTVLPKKLNLRAGPGENYSVLGVLERGAPVVEVITKDDWMEIEPPPNAYAFVAAIYLKQEAAAPVVAAPPSTETVPAPTPTPAPEVQPAVAQATNAPAPAEANPPPAPPAPAPEPATVATNVPPPTRVAMHEGVVRHVSSLIAPTEYELYDPVTDVNVNFLYTTSTNLNLGRYVGMRIVVTGPEGLAERWPDTPVLTIQRIVVIDTNAVPQRIYGSPRSSQRH